MTSLPHPVDARPPHGLTDRQRDPCPSSGPSFPLCGPLQYPDKTPAANAVHLFNVAFVVVRRQLSLPILCCAAWMLGQSMSLAP